MSPSRETELRRLTARPFAHRGLHGPGRIENSRAAFEAAIEARHGIELDVQAIAGGEPVVFHDYDLARLTEARGPVAGLAFEDVPTVRLKGSDETLPTLEEVLELVSGRVPLLIEIKARGPAYHQLCHHVATALHGYQGPVGVMSFNPRVGHFFARHFAHVLRGLVVSEKGKKGPRGWIERRASLAWARPDFLAYDIRDLPSGFAESAQRRGLRVLTWTVRTMTERARASEHADQIIYEAEAR